MASIGDKFFLTEEPSLTVFVNNSRILFLLNANSLFLKLKNNINAHVFDQLCLAIEKRIQTRHGRRRDIRFVANVLQCVAIGSLLPFIHRLLPLEFRIRAKLRSYVAT